MIILLNAVARTPISSFVLISIVLSRSPFAMAPEISTSLFIGLPTSLDIRIATNTDNITESSTMPIMIKSA